MDSKLSASAFRVGEDLCVGCEAWARDVVVDGEGATHVVLVNWGVNSTTSDVTVTWEDLGWAPGAGAAVRDLWDHVDLDPVVPGTADAVTAIQLPPGGSAILKLTPMDRR